MGADRIALDLDVLADLAERVRVVDGVLDALDDLVVDPEVLGDPGVASATTEAQRGWHLDRATLQHRLGTLAVYVDAAATAAQRADQGIVTGRAG